MNKSPQSDTPHRTLDALTTPELPHRSAAALDERERRLDQREARIAERERANDLSKLAADRHEIDEDIYPAMDD